MRRAFRRFRPLLRRAAAHGRLVAGFVIAGGIGGIVTAPCEALPWIALVVGLALLAAFSFGPLRIVPGTQEARATELLTRRRELEDFLRERSRCGGLPDGERRGDDWERHFHGDAAHQEETKRIFRHKHWPRIDKLLAAVAGGFPDAQPDRDFVQHDHIDVEDIWVFSRRVELTAEALHGRWWTVRKTLVYVEYLADSLLAALPPDGDGEPHERFIRQAQSLRERLYLALKWGRGTAARANLVPAARPDLAASEIREYVVLLRSEISAVVADVEAQGL